MSVYDYAEGKNFKETKFKLAHQKSPKYQQHKESRKSPGIQSRLAAKKESKLSVEFDYNIIVK